MRFASFNDTGTTRSYCDHGTRLPDSRALTLSGCETLGHVLRHAISSPSGDNDYGYVPLRFIGRWGRIATCTFLMLREQCAICALYRLLTPLGRVRAPFPIMVGPSLTLRTYSVCRRDTVGIYSGNFLNLAADGHNRLRGIVENLPRPRHLLGKKNGGRPLTMSGHLCTSSPELDGKRVPSPGGQFNTSQLANYEIILPFLSWILADVIFWQKDERCSMFAIQSTEVSSETLRVRGASTLLQGKNLAQIYSIFKVQLMFDMTLPHGGWVGV